LDDNETLRVLRSIDRRLALLAGPQERDLRAQLVANLLRTPARTALFDAIDGKRGSPELADAAKVSDRAAQLFVKEMLDIGVVVVVGGTNGRGFIVDRDDDAIVRWHLQRMTGT
jgi:hypothetical protein